MLGVACPSVALCVAVDQFGDGFVGQGSGVLLTQGPPTSATVADGAGYSGQLTVTNAAGTVSYTETASADSSDVVVNSSGAITAATPLAPGAYTVSGTDSDTAGDTGTWSFALTINEETKKHEEEAAAKKKQEEEAAAKKHAEEEATARKHQEEEEAAAKKHAEAAADAEITALLGGKLTPSGKAAKIAALLKSGGFTVTFKALEAGSAAIDWYYLPPGAKLAKKAKPKSVLVGAGQRTFSAAGTATIKIKLTAAGKSLLKHATKLKLTAKGTFTPTGKTAITATRTFVLKR
jgi:hypothetical protein